MIVYHHIYAFLQKKPHKNPRTSIGMSCVTKSLSEDLSGFV